MRTRRQATLVIFARRPQFGVGKRRLAAEIGDVATVQFQRRAIETIKRRCAKDQRWQSLIATSPDRPGEWATPCLTVRQGGGSLGDRLDRVLRKIPRGPVVVIGSDAPQVGARDIACAFTALRRADAVLGPSPDGGFWLIGLRRPDRVHPFANVRWSTENALADVLRNLSDRKVAILRGLEDVDDAASLRRLRVSMRSSFSSESQPAGA